MSGATQHNGDNATHEFHYDWDHSMRYALRFLYVFLAFTALAIWRVTEDTSLNSGGSIFFGLAFVLLLIGLPALAFMYRANNGLALFEVGPDGIASPINGFEQVPWTRVESVVYMPATGAQVHSDSLRIRFRPGTLQTRQFANVKKDRWEITLSVSTGLFGWQASKLKTSKEELFASIERYFYVTR